MFWLFVLHKYDKKNLRLSYCKTYSILPLPILLPSPNTIDSMMYISYFLNNAIKTKHNITVYEEINSTHFVRYKMLERGQNTTNTTKMSWFSRMRNVNEELIYIIILINL
jgi:hypothetical protein